MSICIVTGSSGLIGSEAARFFHNQGLEVIGIDNNMREYFFGSEGSTSWIKSNLEKELKGYTHYNQDIRDFEGICKIFDKYKGQIKVVIHTAAQPSHDWSYREPHTDFGVNAIGTLNLLEAHRKLAQDSIFLFTSTNKVYGDRPNSLPLIEHEKRFDLDPTHPYYEYGYDENFSIDQSKHSIFGASKVAADIMVQEYILHYGIKGGIFRGGCLTGPAHSSVELHGFLSYLAKCAATEKKYTIFGYKGKQVRDNIHSYDFVNALWHFFEKPRTGNTVYNLGGARHSNCSVLEAIEILEKHLGKSVNFELSDQARIGDSKWLIGDIRKFQNDYPDWKFKYDIKTILHELADSF